MKPHSDSAATNDFKCPQPSGESVAARDKPDRRRSGIPQEGQTDALPAGVQAGPTPSHSTGVGHQSSAAYTVFWKGEQHVVHGRDRDHAKRVLYMTIPEAKWNEIK